MAGDAAEHEKRPGEQRDEAERARAAHRRRSDTEAKNGRAGAFAERKIVLSAERMFVNFRNGICHGDDAPERLSTMVETRGIAARSGGAPADFGILPRAAAPDYSGNDATPVRPITRTLLKLELIHPGYLGISTLLICSRDDASASIHN
jgi:hypothetical protein